MYAPATVHPVDELRAARRELLAALQGYSPTDLIKPGSDGTWCARDVLLHIAGCLRELSRIVSDLAAIGYQRGDPFDPGPDWSTWNEAQIKPYQTLRPEAAVAGVVTAHARLLEIVDGLDEAALRRRGTTRFGFESTAWDLLLEEAAHEREHAARLAVHARRPLSLEDDRCGHGGPVGASFLSSSN